MIRGLHDHCVERDKYAPAKLRNQINTLFSCKFSSKVIDKISTLKTATLAIGVDSNTAC
jgi:hypothetical protein